MTTMKKTFLFCTKPWFFLTEIPPVFLLIIAILQNSQADGALKLYPLIAVLSLVIIFIFLYFFRMISISNEEIQTIGIFSSRENAIIDKGKTLTAIIKDNGYVKIELSEKTANSSFSWNKDNNQPLTDMNLYRERVVGGKRSVIKLLKYFSVSKEDQRLVLGNEEFSKVYESFNLIGFTENDHRHIKIEFTQTI